MHQFQTELTETNNNILIDNNKTIIGTKLAPYNPTNIDAIHIAIDLLKLNSNDILYDLGCGDGRFLIEVLVSLIAIHYSLIRQHI